MGMRPGMPPPGMPPPGMPPPGMPPPGMPPPGVSGWALRQAGQWYDNAETTPSALW